MRCRFGVTGRRVRLHGDNFRRGDQCGWPSPLIGKLADAQGGVAPKFQSATDRSDRRRLKTRDHLRTRDDLPLCLGGSTLWKNAPLPSGAKSWARGGEGAIIGLNNWQVRGWGWGWGGRGGTPSQGAWALGERIFNQERIPLGK